MSERPAPNLCQTCGNATSGDVCPGCGMPLSVTSRPTSAIVEKSVRGGLDADPSAAPAWDPNGSLSGMSEGDL